MKNNMTVNSFDEVVSKYNNVKPLRGARKSLDIRPLGVRRNWFNRIIKVSDTQYVLHDSLYMHQTGSDVTEYAPIIWERKEDGDYLTVRLCSSGSYSLSRYSFLSAYLPDPLWFRIENGKHYVVEGGRGWGTEKVSEHYLPKFKLKLDANKNWVMDKDYYIQFKHVGGKFTRTTELLPMKLRRLDKDLVNKYDPLIKEMWDWAHIVMPILGDTMKDRSTRQGYAEVFEGSSWYWDRQISPDLVKEILENPEHDNRMALCALACYNAGVFHSSDDNTDGRFNPTHKKAFSEFKKILRKVAGVQAVELR